MVRLGAKEISVETKSGVFKILACSNFRIEQSSPVYDQSS